MIAAAIVAAVMAGVAFVSGRAIERNDRELASMGLVLVVVGGLAIGLSGVLP